MRILYLTEEAITFSDTMIRGGAIHVKNVVQGLRERGHDVTLVDWNNEPEQPFQTSVRPWLRFVVDPARTVRRAVAVGRRQDVEVIISKTRKTYLPGLVTARWLGIPHVVHVGAVPTSTTDSLRSRLEGASVAARLRSPHDAYFVVGDSVRDVLIDWGVDAERIYDVRNAVDTDAFAPGDDDPLPADLEQAIESADCQFLVGYVGSLHWYKGLRHLADALDRCETNALAVIVGDGPERQSLEERFGDHGAFIGAVPYEDVPGIYRAIDAFVIPSYTETLSRVVLEAMATQTPVIATRVGGIPEIVTDGENGLLCPSKDPAALADAIDRLAADPELRQRLATAGRETVRRSWSWDAMLNRYEAALDDVISTC